MKPLPQLLAEAADRWRDMPADQRLGSLLLVSSLETEDAALFKLCDWDQLPPWLQEQIAIHEQS